MQPPITTTPSVSSGQFAVQDSKGTNSNPSVEINYSFVWGRRIHMTSVGLTLAGGTGAILTAISTAFTDLSYEQLSVFAISSFTAFIGLSSLIGNKWYFEDKVLGRGPRFLNAANTKKFYWNELTGPSVHETPLFGLEKKFARPGSTSQPTNSIATNSALSSSTVESKSSSSSESVSVNLPLPDGDANV